MTSGMNRINPLTQHPWKIDTSVTCPYITKQTQNYPTIRLPRSLTYFILNEAERVSYLAVQQLAAWTCRSDASGARMMRTSRVRESQISVENRATELKKCVFYLLHVWAPTNWKIVEVIRFKFAESKQLKSTGKLPVIGLYALRRALKPERLIRLLED